MPARLRFWLARPWVHLFLGVVILAADLATGPFLQFPILFVLPVTLASWYCGPRLAMTLASLLPLGRLAIAWWVDQPSPAAFILANFAIRVLVLVLISALVSRTARDARALERRVESLVTICAWSRTVEYQGEWISFEEYLQRRFGVDSTHGISPESLREHFGDLEAGSGPPTEPRPPAA